MSGEGGDTSFLPQPPPTAATLSDNLQKTNISPSFTIWPPTQRTRDAVINRLTQTLSSPSVLTNRYGSLPLDEATSTAKAIEEDAYNAVAATVAAADSSIAAVTNIDDGIEILQVYSKEISKRMIEAVKSKAIVSVDTSEISIAAPESDRATVASEDVSNSVDEHPNN